MQPVRIADDAFCIALLGDFLGEESWFPGVAEVTWDPRRATPDTVLGLAGLRPRIRVPVGEGEETEEIEFSSLESFEPGDLFQRLSLFAPFRDSREAAKLGPLDSAPPQETGPPVGGGGMNPGPEANEGSNLLDMILDQAPPPEEGALPRTREELESFVREVVRPHLVRPDDDAPTRVAAVDEEASALMSGLIHSGTFQRLEGLWRSMVVLLSRIDTIGKVRVYLVHLPKGELERDLLEGEDPLRSKLHDLLSAPELGVPGRKWAVVAGAYGFQFAPNDISLLGRIAQVAKAADVPWISSIQPETVRDQGLDGKSSKVGFQGPPEEWTRLREKPEAAWLGLTYPRFLVREPFGRSPRRSKVFDFQERATSPGDFLWGEGAILCAALLAQGFVADGLGFRPEDRLELGGMPLSGSWEESGTPSTPVEIRLSVTMAEELARLGLIPFLGFPERAGVRVGGFHSVAFSGASLQAWWKS
jgi:type VI secretion system protein ImpC